MFLEQSVDFKNSVPKELMDGEIYPGAKLTHEELRMKLLALTSRRNLDLATKNEIMGLVDSLFPEDHHYCQKWKEFANFISYPWRCKAICFS